MANERIAGGAVAPDDPLGRLEAMQREEAPAPGALFERETRTVRIPAHGSIPRSDALLERLYAGELVPREKKPMVVDTRRSWGPFMVSIDDEPLVVLDACSQIATLTHGFQNPWIVQAIHDGRFGSHLWSNPDTVAERVPEVDELARALRDRAPAGLGHVCFVAAGGAEANEKALRIARMHAPNGKHRTRVLALQHSFHGRTLVALGATWNPTKRAAFEWDGHETVFAEPTLESIARMLDEHGDEIYAVIAEPMMAEGGDVHLRRDFLLGVRRLTREHDLPLLIDEVQTGFATGGKFFWWQRLGLGDDADTSPDLLTVAKKAVLGAVLSRWPDPEPAPVHVASVIRGLIHAQHAEDQQFLEQAVRPRLDALASRHANLDNPRCAGTTFAFDMPDADAARAFIAQRFQRGFMTYPAGERTIRFRLSAGWTADHLDDLFARIHRALELLGTDDALDWQAEGPSSSIEGVEGLELRSITDDDWPVVMQLQQVYEPARRSPEAVLRGAAARGVGLVAVDSKTGTVLGVAVAGRVEDHDDAGPAQDPTRGDNVTLYSVDVTVSAGARGRGVGRALKRAQLLWARERGYRFVTGRNKIGATDAMMALNRSFGAVPLASHEGQYGGDASTEYYQIAVGPPPEPRMRDDEPSRDHPVDLASGIQRPFGATPEFMRGRELVGPAASKLNMSNYATLDSVHYLEHLRLICPRGTSHVYTTSSRDETVDKGLRCLRLARPRGQIAIGFEGGYVGHTTAAARSISDPAGFGHDLALYDWPRLPHPSRDGASAMVAALDAAVAKHGANAILGVVVELVGERSGRVLSPAAAKELAQACTRHDVPLVVVETTTGGYRTGTGPWGVDVLPPGVVPDMVLWYPGGALGHVFVGDRYYVGKPLTLMSTWDGDELCMIRAHEHLRAARKLDTEPARAELDRMLVALTHRLSLAQGGGIGLYRTVSLIDHQLAERIYAACLAQGLRLGWGSPGTLVFAPALDVDPDVLRKHALNMLRRALEELPS